MTPRLSPSLQFLLFLCAIGLAMCALMWMGKL